MSNVVITKALQDDPAQGHLDRISEDEDDQKLANRRVAPACFVLGE